MDLCWLFYIGLFLIGILLFACYSRTGRMLRCMFFTMCTGLPALVILWMARGLLSFPLALTPFSVLASVLLGIPGVVAMLVMNLM